METQQHISFKGDNAHYLCSSWASSLSGIWICTFVGYIKTITSLQPKTDLIIPHSALLPTILSRFGIHTRGSYFTQPSDRQSCICSLWINVFWFRLQTKKWWNWMNYTVHNRIAHRSNISDDFTEYGVKACGRMQYAKGFMLVHITRAGTDKNF